MFNKPYRCITFGLVMTFIGSCTKTNERICSDNGSLFQSTAFRIGVAVNDQELKFNTQFADIAQRQFNSITAENTFKANVLHPELNLYNWSEADKLADYCTQNNKRLHGHTLIWHQQLPEWITNFQGSKTDWENLFKQHIQTIVTHFKGKVESWDVVNEAFNEDGTLRNSIWKQKLGNDYIRRAFEYAHEADPEALLFYNDFNLESNPTKRNNVLAYLNNLKFDDVAVDGIGIQMHININSPEATEIAKTFEDFVKFGYLVHVSELDISVNPSGKDIEPDKLLLNSQADKYAEIARLYKQIPEDLKHGITIWGLSDKDSWIPKQFNRKDFPLLYDTEYKPKPCYCQFLDAL